MKLAGIIQARMSSSRLPGKVLKEAGGQTILERMLRRVKHSRQCEQFIVATSVDPSDNPIEDFCKKTNTQFYRGPLQDVAKRFQQVIEKFNLDAFIRLNADSPWMDAGVIDQAVEIFNQGNAPIVTNTLKRSFPKGESVEVFESKLFTYHYPKFSMPDEFEHVTQYFYKRPEQFNIHNFSAPQNYSQMNLCVDTQADYELLQTALKKLGAKAEDASWLSLVDLYQNIQPQNTGKEN